MLTVACIQPKIYLEKKQCYSEIEKLLQDLVNKTKCDIACLPERWIPFERNQEDNFQQERGKDYSFIKNLAGEYGVSLISGAIWEKRKNMKKPRITSYFFNENGEEIARQDKIHLYSYEKSIFEDSDELKLISRKNYNFSILICFDMAFFETPRLATENGADVLFSPTQIRKDGMDNWEIYLKARALENRIPVVGCNSHGEYYKRNFPGRSKIISFEKGYVTPSKLRIIEAPSENSAIIYDTIDLEFPRKIREIRLTEKIEKEGITVSIIDE